MTHAALRLSLGRSSMNSFARRLATIEMEQASASFPRLRGSMSIPGKKPEPCANAERSGCRAIDRID